MPQIKVEHIVSFSSEDPSHPANNLLSKDIVNKRWIGQEKGEASVSVILQLEKSTPITSIHIGSYHSALVEVLVGRSEASSQAYEVLLCASTFMTPADSRNSVNISRVRTFTTEQLVASVQSKNWDRVRVVCTQPFNRHVQYGLSFIHLFSSNTQPNTAEVKMTLPTAQPSLGRFKLRDLSSDEEDSGGSFKPGELFAKAKQAPSLSTDAQIRKAGTATNLDTNKESNLLVKTARTPNLNKPSTGKKCKTTSDEDVPSRGRDQLMYDDDDDNANAKIDRIIKRDRDAKNEMNKKIALDKLAQAKNEPKKGVSKFDFRNKTPKKNDSADSDSKAKDAEKPKVKLNYTIETDDSKKKNNKDIRINNNNNKRKLPHDDGESPSNKTPRNNTKKNVVDSPTPFDNIIWGPQCLRGVVFVLSGYVNPKRSILRDTVISLGGRYSPDWGPSCTHLVCAFANTPKHEQVRKAGGDVAIVGGNWIEECGTEKAHLPWQWFALDRKKKIDRPPGPLKKPEPKKVDVHVPTTSASRDDSDDEEVKSNTRIDINMLSESGEDTDDEIEKLMKKNDEIENAKNDLAKNKTKTTAKRHVDQLSDESLTDMEDSTVATKINEKEPLDKKLLCIYDQDTDVDSD